MSVMQIGPQSIDSSKPYWAGFRQALQALSGTDFPNVSRLNTLRPDTLLNNAKAPIIFKSATELGQVEYERHIYEHGEVSTREENGHDLFNALVWCHLPALKLAFNHCHYQELGKGHDAGQRAERSRMRDALTLLDESGVLVVADDTALLEALARRDWLAAFQLHRAAWQQTRVIICGHALLEKFLDPYKAMTAHGLLIHDPLGIDTLSLDQLLAQRLLADGLFRDPTGLSPIPLMGIPGWWSPGTQDAAFYADRDVFRVPVRSFALPSVHQIA